MPFLKIPGRATGPANSEVRRVLSRTRAVTFGLLLILEDLVAFIWGKGNHSLFTPDLLNFSVNLFGESVPAYRIGVIFVGAAVAMGLTLWLRYSRIGLFVRAASTDPVTTSMQGVNTDRLGAAVVGLGAAADQPHRIKYRQLTRS